MRLERTAPGSADSGDMYGYKEKAGVVKGTQGLLQCVVRYGGKAEEQVLWGRVWGVSLVACWMSSRTLLAATGGGGG